MKDFHKEKYYRVVRKTNRDGTTQYEVQSATRLIDVLFGMWTNYKKENDTLASAINQIESIDGARLVSKEVVYRETKNKSL